MDIYLKFNNNEDILRLPVLPSSFGIQGTNANSTVNINSLGEINLIGKVGLSVIKIESFFPAQEYPFAQYVNAPKPYECVKLIDKWRASGKPIRLIITDTPINLPCAIESFDYTQKDGTGDVHFSLGLKQYRFLKSPLSDSAKTSGGAVVKVPSTIRESKPIPKTYSVKKGDTLYAIAKKVTGAGENYKVIASTNGIKNPDKIYPGQKLVI